MCCSHRTAMASQRVWAEAVVPATTRMEKRRVLRMGSGKDHGTDGRHLGRDGRQFIGWDGDTAGAVDEGGLRGHVRDRYLEDVGASDGSELGLQFLQCGDQCGSGFVLVAV